MMPYCEIIDISDDSDNDCEFLGETQGEIYVIQIVAEKKGNRVATNMSNKSVGDIVLEEVIAPIDDKQSPAEQATSSTQEDTDDQEHVEEVPIQDIPQLQISAVPLSTDNIDKAIIETGNQPQMEKISTTVEPEIEAVGASTRKRKVAFEGHRTNNCQEKKYRIMPPKLPQARVRNPQNVEGSAAAQMARTMMQPKSKLENAKENIYAEEEINDNEQKDSTSNRNSNLNVEPHQAEHVVYKQTMILTDAIEPQLEPNQTTQSIQLNELNAETVNGSSGEPYEQPEVPINMPKQAPVLLVHTNEEFELDQQVEDVLEIELTDNTGSLYHVNLCLAPNNDEIISETNKNEQHMGEVHGEEFNNSIGDIVQCTETGLSENNDTITDDAQEDDHNCNSIRQEILLDVHNEQEDIIVLDNDSEVDGISHVPHYDLSEEIVAARNDDEPEEVLDEEIQNQDHPDSEPEEICNTSMPVLRLRRQSSEDSEYLPPKKSSKRKATGKTRNMRQEKKSNQEPMRALRGRKRKRIADDDEVQQNLEIIEKAHCIDQLKHNNHTSAINNGSQEASSPTEIEEISTETSNGDNYPELEMTRPKTKPPVLSRASSEQPPGSPSSPPNSSPPPKKTKKDNKRGDASTSRCEDQLSQLSLSDKESDGNDCPPLKAFHEGRKVPVQKDVPEDPDNVREHIAYLLDKANQGNTRKPSDAPLINTMSGINRLFKPASEGHPENADSIGGSNQVYADSRQPLSSAGTSNAVKMLCSGKQQQQKEPSSSKPVSSPININLQSKAQMGNQEFEELPEHLRSKISAFTMKGMLERNKRKSTDPAKAERDAKLKAEKEAKKIEKEEKKKTEKEAKQAEKEAKKKRKSSLKPSEILILNDVLPTRAHSHISSPLSWSPEPDENIDPMVAALLEPAHWSMPLKGNVRRMADQLNAGRIPQSPFPQVLSDPLQNGSVQEILNRFGFMFLSPHVYPFNRDLVSDFDFPPWDNQQSDCALHLLERSLKELQNTTAWHMWMIEKVKQDRMTEERSRYARNLRKVEAASAPQPTVQPTVPATSVPSTSGLTTAPVPPSTSSASTVQQTHPTVIKHLNTPSTEYQVAENVESSVMPELVDVVTLEDDIEPSIQHSSPITENPTELQETTAHLSPLQPANLVPMVPVSVEPLVIPMEFVLRELAPDAAMPHFAVVVPGPEVQIWLIPGNVDPGTTIMPAGGILRPITIQAPAPLPSYSGSSPTAPLPMTPSTSATNVAQDVPVEPTNYTPTTGKNTTRQTKQKKVKIDTVRQYVPILPKPLSQQPRQKAAPEPQPSVPFQMLVKALKKKWKPASACLPPQNTEKEDGMPTLTPGMEASTQSQLRRTASGHTFKMPKKSPPKPGEQSPCCINPHIKKNMKAVKDLELNGWSRQGPSTSAEPSTSSQPSTSVHDASNNDNEDSEHEQKEAESETETYDDDIAELERRIPGQKNPRRNALKLRKNQNPRGIVKVQMNRMRHYSALAIQSKQILGVPGYGITDPPAPVVKAPKKEKLPLFQLPRQDQRAIRSILSKVINKVSGVKTRNRHRSPQLPARNVYSRRTKISQINQRT